MSSDLALVSKFPNEPVAQVAQAILEANGIPSILSSDGASGLEPQLLFVLGVRLLVRSEDLAVARELLEVSGNGPQEEIDAS